MITALAQWLSHVLANAVHLLVAAARVPITMAHSFTGGRPTEAVVIAVVLVPGVVAMIATISRQERPQHRRRTDLAVLCLWGAATSTCFLLSALSIGVIQ
jgi:hypothetical protein